LRRPDLTAERFLPDRFAGRGQRLYRTGDLVRIRPDGLLEHLGRLDDQVKLRGIRIELAEVEAALRNDPAVRDAAAVVQQSGGDSHLVGHVVPSDAGFDTRTVIERLRARVPSHLVPAFLEPVDAIPRTPSGKIDRARLRDVRTDQPARPHVRPLTAAERALARIWVDVLNVAEPGPDEDFFDDLGGDSLLAIRMIGRVETELGARLSVATLFTARTLGKVAASIGLAADGPEPAVPRRPRSHTHRTVGPVTRMQEIYYAQELVDPSNAFAKPPGVYRLTGPIDAHCLERALEAVAVRHEILRTTYELENGRVRAVVRPPERDALPKLEYEDLRGRPADSWPISSWFDVREFDLAREPILRTKLIKLGEQDHALAVCAHHIGFDGPSVGVFWRELDAAYDRARQGAAGDPSRALPSLPFQYLDFAEHVREYTASPDGQRECRFWEGVFDGAPPLELPIDFPRHEVDREREHRPYVACFPAGRADP
jgi:acyl carrier protein